MKDFDLTDRAEFLHDYANAISGRFGRYMLKHRIDDKNNEIYKIWMQINRLEEKAYYINNEEEYNQIKDALDQLDKELPNE
ncbi:MAG: hypothetical protein IKN85_13635 [Oscillospiraceae bacterium]|nr:hypothetical protein [Oscillospiraceae bacterium]MBR3536863.1 hypothetical protein [Oscillospiraceae bacterium]MBR4344539.1 hypothetical protein [Lachnospiraceae bacterium]MBR6837294.1 hypothetical protein [Oscillospiraceae bacterium]